MPLKSSLLLSDLCFLVKDTCNYTFVNPATYVSTDSMLPDKAGITVVESIPSTGTVNKYQPKDILVSNIRPYFKKIWQSDRYGTCSNDVLVIRAKDNLISDYLFALLSEDRFFDYVMLGSKGTKMPRGDKNQILSYPVCNLSFSEMLAIGHWIAIINQKIACNLKINANLFAILRVKYRKLIAGKCTPALLADIANIESGKRPERIATELSLDNTVPVIGAAKIMGFTNNSMFNERMLVTGRVGTHGVIQRYCSEIWPSDNTLTIRTPHYEFVYQVLMDVDYSALNRGSTQPLITQSDLKNIEIWWPCETELQNYEESVAPITSKIESLQAEILSLSRLRDYLLPKLMSGEIDVSNMPLPN